MGLRNLVVAAVGFGCLVGFARMASLGFVGYLSCGIVESTDAWYGLRVATSLATLAALAFAGARGRSAMPVPALLAITAMAVASAIVFAVDGAGRAGAFVALLAGCSSSALMYVWFLFLSSRPAKEIVAISAAGLVVAGAIVMGVPRVEPALGLIVAAFAAFWCGMSVLLAEPGLSACAADGPPGRGAARRLPWFSIAAMVSCGIVATVVYGIAEQLTWLYDWRPNYLAFGAAAACAIVATFAVMMRGGQWTRHVWVPQFALLVAALAFSCFSVREALQVSVGLLLASVFCAHFLHWPVFSAMLSQAAVPRACLAGVLLLVSNGSLATMLGEEIGAALPHSMQNLGGVAGLAVIVLGALLVAAHAASRALLRETDAEAEPDEPGQAAPAETALSRMERLAAEFKLTPRESEVAMLTVQGYSAAYIAEKLVVSNSTVRYHQQNLYRKLDVHSRNELIDLASEEIDSTGR